jgi:hypothetical protein
MSQHHKGDFVHLDGSGVGIVVATPEDDAQVPEEHLGVWFGTLDEEGNPEVWTVPAEYLRPAPTSVYRH